MKLVFAKSAGVVTSSPTGSNYTCDPPVTDTDVDYLVLVQDLWQAVEVLERVEDWCLCQGADGAYQNDKEYANTWYAMRKGNINLIMTDDPAWYQRAVHATTVCKQRNILDKADRIIVFRWLRDGGGNKAQDTVDEAAFDAALKRWSPQ